MAEARRVPDETPVRSEPMPYRAVRWRTDSPGARRGLNKVADHGLTVARADDEIRAAMMSAMGTG
jgi:hypothetical protein